MSMIEEKFKDVKERNEGVLIAYITAGLPEPSCTINVCSALIKGGADIIELGIPFSDPIADGKTIQRSSYLALKKGVKTKAALNVAKSIKEEFNIPLILLSYYNPIYKIGINKFLNLAKKANIDGLIIPDLPVDEADEYVRLARNFDIDTIFLASPNTSKKRLSEIVKKTKGFLYLVSSYGVTGVRERLEDYTINVIKRFSRLVDGKTYLAVGFGLSKQEQIKAILRNGADGVIVGSLSLIHI